MTISRRSSSLQASILDAIEYYQNILNPKPASMADVVFNFICSDGEDGRTAANALKVYFSDISEHPGVYELLDAAIAIIDKDKNADVKLEGCITELAQTILRHVCRYFQLNQEGMSRVDASIGENALGYTAEVNKAYEVTNMLNALRQLKAIPLKDNENKSQVIFASFFSEMNQSLLDENDYQKEDVQKFIASVKR